MALAFVEEERVRDGALPVALQRRQVLLMGVRVQFGHGCNSWHIRLRAVAGHFILDLQLVKPLALVKRIGVRGTPALLHGRSHALVDCTARCARLVRSVTAALVVVVVPYRVILVVDKPLALKEVFAPLLLGSHWLLAERVVLDVD